MTDTANSWIGNFYDEPEVKSLSERFGDPTKSRWWDYWNDIVPPGVARRELQEDAVVAFVLDKSARGEEDLVENDDYQAATRRAQAYMQAHPDYMDMGTPEEYQVVRDIVNWIYETAREYGEEGSAEYKDAVGQGWDTVRAHPEYGPIIDKYYPPRTSFMPPTGPPLPPREDLPLPPTPLPWSYYQRTGRKIGVPEDFDYWIRENYPISPQWEATVGEAEAWADLKTEWGGYYARPKTVARHPFAIGTYIHELGHHMDVEMSKVEMDGPMGQKVIPTCAAGGISSSSAWYKAVKRWRDDPDYTESGERIWSYITGGHPHGSPEKPVWHEGYAHACEMGFSETPRYIRKFFPWRDWKTIERGERDPEKMDIAKTLQEQQEARDRAYREEVAIQNAQDVGMTASELERMWGGNYQEHPIPYMVFAFTHGQYDSPEQARAEWDKIPEADRRMALEWFFDGIWPIMKDDPGEWQAEKDFLDFIGIADVREQQAKGSSLGTQGPDRGGGGLLRTWEEFRQVAGPEIVQDLETYWRNNKPFTQTAVDYLLALRRRYRIAHFGVGEAKSFEEWLADLRLLKEGVDF